MFVKNAGQILILKIKPASSNSFMSRLYQKYHQEIISFLKKDLKKNNSQAVPGVEKVVINMGIGDISKDKNAMAKAAKTLALITGQKAQERKAKKAIADFKIRKNDVIGLRVTLRGKRAFVFLDKLFSVVLPKVRDFQGISKKSFDGSGNYTLGLSEQLIFPEVDYDTIDKIRGLEVTIVTTSKNDKEAKSLMSALGAPFAKD